MPEDESHSEADVTYSGDPALNLLVHIAEGGASIGVTVYTSGLVFSGLLSSRRAYFEAMRDNSGALASMFQEFIAVMDQNESENGDDDETPAPDYRFLHLLRGKVFSPNSDGMPQEGIPIRLDREKIVGWSLGLLHSSH
ncbi:hypothetical protein [Sphingobium yanoikuyae]|uniref:hypothetical protein n=1 Tax=Sphingobium yanoikuyae TaxID=13690 RepID=UPI0012900E41|nr:hypothetical protein [Sphingobium yanoikuyae]